MAGELHRVIAGIAAGPAENEGEHLVDPPSLHVHGVTVVGAMAGGNHEIRAPEEPGPDGESLRSRKAHHSQARRARRRRRSDDRILEVPVHLAPCGERAWGHDRVYAA